MYKQLWHNHVTEFHLAIRKTTTTNKSQKHYAYSKNQQTGQYTLLCYSRKENPNLEITGYFGASGGMGGGH